MGAVQKLESMPNDELLQETAEAIVTTIAEAIDGEKGNVQVVHLPNGPEVGRQITIDATEKGGLKNMCRLSFLNPDIAPDGEVVRMEFEHDKQGSYGVHEVYSVQSVRRINRKLVLMENFLAENVHAVREEDFRPILSEAYAKQTVLKSVQDWTRFRKWQRQTAGKKA